MRATRSVETRNELIEPGHVPLACAQKRIRIPQRLIRQMPMPAGAGGDCCNALVFFWVITMRQQNLTFNVSSIRRRTQSWLTAGGVEGAGGGAGGAGGAAVTAAKKVRRKNLNAH